MFGQGEKAPGAGGCGQGGAGRRWSHVFLELSGSFHSDMTLLTTMGGGGDKRENEQKLDSETV